MGMCKDCGNVMGAIEMENGYCKECFDSSAVSKERNKPTVKNAQINKTPVGLTEERLKKIEEAYIGVKKEIRILEKKIKDEGDYEPYHIIHFILSIFTHGIWLVIWLIAVIVSVFLKAGRATREAQLEELYELRDEAEMKMRRNRKDTYYVLQEGL